MWQLLAWLAFGAVTGCQAGSPCLGADPLPSVDVVLAKWEESSRKLQCMDAKLTVFQYDVFTGDQPKITRGRFYYEAPNLARYEVTEHSDRATNNWSKVSEAILWKADETLWIEGTRLTCMKLSKAKMQSVLPEDRGTTENPQSWFFGGFARYLARKFESAQQYFPLLVGIRAAEVKEKFDLTMERNGEDILIRATPKRASEKADYHEVAVILNAKTFLARATQVIALNGRDRTVYMLDDQKVNERPSDRDELVAPDLSQFHVTEGP
jgi:outer membrane lipoprotein-sorting protein